MAAAILVLRIVSEYRLVPRTNFLALIIIIREAHLGLALEVAVCLAVDDFLTVLIWLELDIKFLHDLLHEGLSTSIGLA